jgi:hypothetical protein
MKICIEEDTIKIVLVIKVLSVKFTLEQAMKVESEVQVLLYSVTSALDGGSWSTSRSGPFTPVKETRYPL